MIYTDAQTRQIETEFATIEHSTQRHIFDHHYDIAGTHKDSPVKQAWVNCPSCRGAWSSTETMWDHQYRNGVALLGYESDLDKVADIDLQAVLLVAETFKIRAIKMLRSLYPTIGLFNAKRIVERCSVETKVEVTYEVTRN